DGADGRLNGRRKRPGPTVLLYPITLVLGALAGYALGGRLSHLGHVRWRYLPLVAAAIVMQVGLSLRPVRHALGDRTWDAVVISYALVGVWLLLNVVRGRGPVRVGVLVAAAGWLLNIAVMVPNGGMPVSVRGLEAAGAPADFRVTSGHLYKHVE